MALPLLRSKLFVPPIRPALVSRPRLLEQLDAGVHRKLTLISAPAGFGKSTLVSEWLSSKTRPIAWLSLDEQDSDPTRFLTYLVAALDGIQATLGERVSGMLQGTQPPPTEVVLSLLLNELAALPEPITLVLDDYHVIQAPAVDEALTFLLAHQPPQLHLVISTREDPSLPLARLRARGQLTELRAADLRFSVEETAAFLNQIMGLNLSAAAIAALEARTEGWIAGLQMAAISMRGRKDHASFIDTFSGSHRFVLDYLMEEVLQQQSSKVQTFLLKTSMLNQLSGPLCDALTDHTDGQEVLESLERANLFLVPLDNERRWYRYHHLFADLLRQQLQQTTEEPDIAALHVRASEWFEANGRELEAFQHATAANDTERAVRLIEGDGLPLYFRGEVIPVRLWLDSLPGAEFKARPSLRVMYASVLTLTGRLHDNIEAILQAAETALQGATPDERTSDLLGQIAAIRAMLGIIKNEADTIITHARRALALLHPNNAPMRTTATWTLGYAYQVQGNRTAATEAYAETIAQSQSSGNIMTEIAATTCVGQIQETENQLHQAAETFERILQLVGDPLWPAACEACVGLARIHYQWNDLEAARRYGEQGLELARQLENVDTPAACGVLLARVKLGQGDVAAALTTLADVEQFVQQRHFSHWDREIAALRIQAHLQQSDLAAASRLAGSYDLPLSQARIHLARGEPDAALVKLEPLWQQAEASDWADLRLQVLVLRALAQQAVGDREPALHTLGEALALAAPGRLIRRFVDEGPPMARLLKEAAARGLMPGYVGTLLAAFPTDSQAKRFQAANDDLIEPLSDRELEVLHLLADGLTNREIAERFYLSLHTVKVHTRNIYGKLGVHSRTQAAARGRALGLLPGR